MTNKRPFLSVIIAAHNCGRYLSETLTSLTSAIGKSADFVEIIIINDSSTDNTEDIINSFANKNGNAKKYSVSYRNIGKVRNFGVEKSSGEYITMLDGDDQLLPNSICDVIGYLKKTQPDIYLTRLNEIRDNNKKGVEWTGIDIKELPQHKAIKTYLIHKEMQAHFIGQFIKSDILKRNPFPEYHCYEDAYLFPTILKNSTKITFQTKGPYLYYKRENSLSSVVDKEKVKMLISAIERMECEFGSRYANLITCHWVNIEHKYGKLLEGEQCRELVLNKIKKTSTLPFLLDFSVRTSFKKKLIRIKSEII